jgi:hypothetical protein
MSNSELPAKSDLYSLESSLPIETVCCWQTSAGSCNEGTREINSLIVGLGITGESAFVGK